MALASNLRAEIARLVGYADRDLMALWRGTDSAAKAGIALRDILPALIEQYGAAAATTATVWYDEQRDKASVGGRFGGIPIESTDRGAQALVGWALSTAQDYGSFQTLIAGGMQRRIADHARHTVMTSAIADPRAEGWERVSRGGCSNGFCDMLAGRGIVFSESSADFAAHDHCECYAVAAWSGRSKPVKSYVPTSRNITDSDRARVREYLRTH